MIGLITAAIMEVLDTTIINVALPRMAGNLNATTDEIAWVATGYILSNVIVLPMTAWLSQRFGRKRYLVFSILLFIVASFFCGASKSLNEVIFWRVMQGAGGAALLSTAQATLRQIFPKEQQGLVQAIFILGIIMAPTLGPTLGGYITDNYNWPWVFYVNIPIGLLSVFLTATFLHDSPNAIKAGPIDIPGIVLLTLGLGSLQYVLEEGQRDDWFDSALIVRLSLLAFVALSAMFAWELSPRNKAPIVDFHVLKNRDLAAGLILIPRPGLRPVRRDLYFPAVYPEHFRLFADQHRPGPAAGGSGDRGERDDLRARDDRGQAAGGSARVDLVRHGDFCAFHVDAGSSQHRVRRTRHAAGADYSRLRAGIFVYADQFHRVRLAEAIHGPAGVGPDQSSPPAWRQLRHRGFEHVHLQPGCLSPGEFGLSSVFG